MSKYPVQIKRIDRKRHYSLRYEIIVYWDKEANRGDVSWTYTLWGAHREAKKMIREHEKPTEVKSVVEEYEL